MERTEIDGRYVHGKANYNGDITESFDLNRAYGPNDNGEKMWPLAVEFNAETNKSTVFFSLNPPVDVVI